jgi:hypothetical protein
VPFIATAIAGGFKRGGRGDLLIDVTPTGFYAG